MPVHNLGLSKEAKNFLPMAGFKPKSPKFGLKIIEKYILPYGEIDVEWKHLGLGQDFGDNQSSTIYCGGTVTSIDWAPSSGESEFLVVASNSDMQAGKMNLKNTSKSCIQVYEFKNLSNKE
jgi:hypothetical protein